MQSDKERIELIIQEKKLNNIEFCNKTSMSPSTLSHILSERTKPTLLVLRSIVEAFPDINPMWILMGEGKMYKSDNQTSTNANNFESQQDSDFIDDIFAPMRNGLGYEPKIDSSQHPQNNGSKQNPANSIATSSAQIQQVSAIKPMTETDVEKIVTTTVTQLQKPQRKVTEVRIFYDDGTFESFSSNK